MTDDQHCFVYLNPAAREPVCETLALDSAPLNQDALKRDALRRLLGAQRLRPAPAPAGYIGR
jgi:hypothetical protein